MDDGNNNNAAEAEADAIDAADAAELKLLSILQRRKNFPFRTRNKIVELAEEYLEKLKVDIHGMLCETFVVGDDYKGLDRDRDTEDEVETAVRELPGVLSRRGGHYNEYPIQCLSSMYGINGGYMFNLKAVPFTAILAQIGNELHQFEEGKRGGLLEDSRGSIINILNHLARCSRSSIQPDDLLRLISNNQDDDHNNPLLLDEIVFLTLLIRLRQMGLFRKEDIQGQDLVINVCCQSHDFEGTRLRFLVEWDPTVLLQADETNNTPLHYAAHYGSSIRGFQLVFEYLIRYYPYQKGIRLLFKKDDNDRTPIKLACRKYGMDNVMDIVEDTLNNSMIPMNAIEALFLTAIDEDVDCMYFLLRRHPTLMNPPLGPNTNNNYDNDDDNDGINRNG